MLDKVPREGVISFERNHLLLLSDINNLIDRGGMILSPDYFIMVMQGNLGYCNLENRSRTNATIRAASMEAEAEDSGMRSLITSFETHHFIVTVSRILTIL